MTGREFKDRLGKRARKMGISLTSDLSDKLWTYVELLAKWNQKINLTALELSEPSPETLDRLLLEPLLAAQYAGSAKTLIDIGSGGGSPALPLALALGGIRLAMVEVKTRKSVFLREAARELGLSDAVVVTARHEALLSDPGFHEAYDVLSIRAVRVESRVFAALQTFVREGGRILHFHSASDVPPSLLLPPLHLLETHALIEGTRSLLTVVVKQEPPVVPRGTLKRQ